MSLYPILWAVEHAPIYDATERAILSALVSKGDFDGCNCYRSYPSLAKIARVDRKTAERKCHAMEKRGILRRQKGRMPEGWLRLPKDKRPVVWEVMIPAEFWSAVQLEEINQQRAERGRSPITPENRPMVPEAPPKKARVDKGKPKPQRRNTSHQDDGGERGDSQSRRSAASGGTLSPVAGGLSVPSRGDSQSPNPPIGPSEKNPPPPRTHESQRPRPPLAVIQEEEESSAGKSTEAEALALVDAAVGLWEGHRPPTRAERLRLAERASQALLGGARPESVSYALTRDLSPSQVRTTAVQVVMGRTARPGWADQAPPAPPAAVSTGTPRCPVHPGASRRPTGECSGCLVDEHGVAYSEIAIN